MSSAFRGKDWGAMNYDTKEETSHYCRTVPKQNQRQAFSEHSAERSGSYICNSMMSRKLLFFCLLGSCGMTWSFWPLPLILRQWWKGDEESRSKGWKGPESKHTHGDAADTQSSHRPPRAPRPHPVRTVVTKESDGKLCKQSDAEAIPA